METPNPPANGTPAPTAGADAAKEAVARYMAAKLPPPQAGTVSPVTQGDKPTNPPASAGDTAPTVGTPEARTFATVIAQSKEIRELKAKLASAATAQPDVLSYQEAKKLWETDPVAALGKAFGGDPEVMADKLMQAYFAGGATPPKTETPPAAASDNPLATEVAELKKWKADREKAEQEATQRAAQETVQKTVDQQMTEIMKGLEANTHALVLRPENRKEAIAFAGAAAVELAKQQGIPLDTKDPKIINDLFREGFIIAETQLREMGKRFMLDASPAPAARPSEQPKPVPAQIQARSTPPPAASVVPTPAVMSVEQAKRKAIADMVAMAQQKR